MRNSVLYIAISIDGYVADINGGVDWLSGENPEMNDPSGYENFINSIDTVLLGHKTYHQIATELAIDTWPYKGMQSYVFTSKNLKNEDEISFVNENVGDLINKLKKEDGKDIWICGGAGIVNQAIKSNAIDKYIISVIPTILGDGIPLFEKGIDTTNLKLVNTSSYNGIVELSYENR